MEDRSARPRLYRQLNEYCRSDAYPFHMPGHKRRTDEPFMAEFPNPYGIDITEIDGFDNLHHAEGILRESMDWAASVYGAGRTYYLVNGSTCGVLAAICAAVPQGGTILMARNSHKSAYHAAALKDLTIRYIYPQIIENFGLQGGLLPQDVEKMLINPDETAGDADRPAGAPAAVFITSPTYDGVVSDVRGIAAVCHRHGVPLIVDEAHGAHFPFGEMFPASALDMGADIVIHSLHKTLPAFTQTALLHVRTGQAARDPKNVRETGLVDRERLEYYLQVFQTSSPSYILMAGIERCIEYMASGGREEMERFSARLTDLRERLRQMRCIRLLDRDVIGQAGVYDLDRSKLILSVRNVAFPDCRSSREPAAEAPESAGGGVWPAGPDLAELLRRDYHLEMEMCGADYITAISTLMDSRDGLDRLWKALLEIDGRLRDAGSCGVHDGSGSPAVPGPSMPRLRAGSAALPRPRPVMSIGEARSHALRTVPLEAAAGSVSGEYVYLYPPGTPVVVPGELLTEEAVAVIRGYRKQRLPIQGLQDHTAAAIRVLV